MAAPWARLPILLAAMRHSPRWRPTRKSRRLPAVTRRPPARKATVGVDLFVQWNGGPDDLAGRLKTLEDGPLALKMITNRGVKVWPDGMPETFCTDHWRCRFMNGGGPVALTDIVALSSRAALAGIDFIKTEHLCTFDGEPGFSLGQGQQARR